MATVETDVAVLTGIKDIKVVKRPVHAPAHDQVQIQINAVGICGSDMAYWSQGLAGGFVELDFTEQGLCSGYCGQMGHECAGTVIGVGQGVSHLKLGDRVALEPGVPCGGQCKPCQTGRYNLCTSMQFIGSAVNKVPGGMCATFNHAAAYCHALPPHVSLEEGAMLEPMCVALHAVTRAGIKMGDKVLVTGAGPIGLLVAQCAKAAGASLVAITDMVEAKLAKAKETGADLTFKANTPGLQALLEEKAGEKMDACFECSGVVPALDLCVRAARSGGTVCVVANMKGETTAVRMQEAARREIDLIGVYRYCNLYPTALALVASGKVDLKPLLSRSFPLSEANAAFEYFATGEPIKVIIQPHAAAPTPKV